MTAELQTAFQSLQDSKPQHRLEVPLVNLNGTSKDALLGQYMAVLQALDSLQTALGEAMPNGRDYQTAKDPNACSKARQAFTERRLILANIREEIYEVAVAISDQ